jgi:Tol biopolymer transport system component
MRKLTETPGAEISPAWSPDGRSIAFIRAGSGVFIMSELGAPERRVSGQGTNVEWTADSKAVMFRALCSGDAPPYCIHLVDLETLEQRILTRPVTGIGDFRSAASPDGKTFAFIRATNLGVGDLFVASLAGGTPRRLTNWNASLTGLAWTPDGREIIYSVTPHDSPASSLWRISAANSSPARGDRIADAGYDAVYPTVSGHSDPRRVRLAWQRTVEDVSLRLVRLAANSSGDVLGPVTTLADATISRDCRGKISPDGSTVGFSSRRTGGGILWLMGRDETVPRKLTTLVAPEAMMGGWSPDGRSIAFDAAVNGNTDIYVVASPGSKAQRLTSEPSNDMCARWSPDGKWVYFHSARSGRAEIWKAPAQGGTAVQVTFDGGFCPQLAGDGYAYYLSSPPRDGSDLSGSGKLKRVALNGGPEVFVLDGVNAWFWSVAAAGIYFLVREPDADWIDFHAFRSGVRSRMGRLPFRVSTLCGGISVSQDGQWLVTNHIDRFDSDLMMIDGLPLSNRSRLAWR